MESDNMFDRSVGVTRKIIFLIKNKIKSKYGLILNRSCTIYWVDLGESFKFYFQDRLFFKSKFNSFV